MNKATLLELLASVERGDLSIDDAIGQGCSGVGDASEFRRPVETFARVERGLAAGNVQLHPISIDLDLVSPAFALGRTVDEPCELRWDEVGHP